ncbi:hypothetical protein BGW38_000618 [Lunasporangiospora selenospora]|uniref:Disintegrin and metalloproteinase domain-containing protein B n=1 Tax=Lunasporangiospora selenospora TaxID=979761 RepID=A0A9P6KEU3_9FUNG|nr:hypothetical protein BGW38_000618 [Lunasporangiospora selenospora]
MMVVQDDSSDLLLLQGAFEVNGEMYHITTRQHYHAQKRDLDHMPSTDDPSQPDLIIYRDSDLNTPTSPPSPDDISPAQTVCGTQSQANTQSKRSYSDSNPLSSASTAHLARRQLISNSTSSPNSIPPGCPTSRKVNYMGIAADCTYVRNYGGKANARRQILSDMNTASQIYESTFNVVLSIQTMTIMSMNCPSTPVNGTEWNQACSPLYDIGERLSDFSRWRGRTYNKDGAALCQMNAQAQGNQYSSGTGVSSVSTNEWLVVAHEIGHGFGAQHDCTASTCGTNSTCCALNSTVCDAKNKYIMNPSELTATTQFSPCTISTICKAISSSAGSCLKPATIQASQVDNGNNTLCGNGVLDPGEQCDCGTSDQCAKDNCCDGDTCRFKNNAVCDDLNDDCCNSCQFAPATQVCRSALSPSCDLPEMCSGLSAACPPDIRIPDLTSCSASGNVTGQCASGICTSRDLQCVQQERPGISKACKALPSSCELVCNDPNGSTSMCTRISGNYFVDGTPCGDSMDSVCRRGRCQPLESWAKRNMGLLIGVCVGGVALLSGLVVMIFCIRRRRRRHAMKSSGEKVKHEAQWAATTESRISQSIPRRTSQVGPMLQNPHSASVPGTTGHPLPVGPSPRLEPAVQASPSVPMGPAFNSTRPVHPLDVDPEAQA